MYPCTNCGNALDIIKGTVVQCFACGVRNSHFESFNLMSEFVQDVFGYPKAIEKLESEIEQSLLSDRMEKIDAYFSNLLLKVNDFRTFFVSKTYSDDLKPLQEESAEVSKQIGMLSITIDMYLLPHLEADAVKSKYQHYNTICKIYNKALLGLRHAIKAKSTYIVEDAAKLYQKARWNFQKSVEIVEDQAKQGEADQFSAEKAFFDVSAQLSVLLGEILTTNPAYYSEKIEEIIETLDSIDLKQAQNLKHQINEIYELSNELPYIMEEIRLSKPLGYIDTERERILYHSEEVIEQFTNAKIWIKDIQDRYSTMQTEIMKLHCGKMVDYLRDYRKEFQNRLSQTIERYNDDLLKVMQTSLLDYTLSSSDLLDEVEQGFTFIKLTPAEVIDRIRYLKSDLTMLDKELKEFLFELLDLGIPDSLKLENVPNIVSTISDKHSSFDKLILKYIKGIFNEFTEERDERRYTIEEQHDKFNIQIRPLIDNLIDVSFTIKPDQIPYPLFIEIAMLTTQLKVEEEYKIFFIIENPSKVTVSGVDVAFFVPNSFRIKIRQYKIGSIKPDEKLTIETRIIPEQPGIFFFMAMVEYEYSAEMYWMPSIKQKLRVVDEATSELDLSEDEFMNAIYKKYGRVSNEEQIKDAVDGSEEISSQLGQEDQKKSQNVSPDDDDLLPDI